MDTGLKRTKIIEGEPFPLKGSVHQLGGTHGDTATEEEDHRECLRGRTRTDPRESENFVVVEFISLRSHVDNQQSLRDHRAFLKKKVAAIICSWLGISISFNISIYVIYKY